MACNLCLLSKCVTNVFEGSVGTRELEKWNTKPIKRYLFLICNIKMKITHINFELIKVCQCHVFCPQTCVKEVGW